MRYIVLSFDDGRRDFYRNAYKILKSYGLVGTLNVIADFADRKHVDCFESANNEVMTWNEIEEVMRYGIEIGNHSANHSNDLKNIKKGFDVINKKLGLKEIGFASPSSMICNANFSKYKYLIPDTAIYIRSGNQVKRDGIFHAILYCLSMITKSPMLFYLYNRRNFIDMEEHQSKNCLLPSVTCNRDNSINQVISCISKLPDNYSAIIMFHSILTENDQGWNKDRWFNTTREFEKLCQYLVSLEDIEVITTIELVKLIKNKSN